MKLLALIGVVAVAAYYARELIDAGHPGLGVVVALVGGALHEDWRRA